MAVTCAKAIININIGFANLVQLYTQPKAGRRLYVFKMVIARPFGEALRIGKNNAAQ